MDQRLEPRASFAGHGEIVEWYGANTDIEDRKRAESLLAAEKRTLEMIAGGAPLIDIIKNLCDTIHDRSPKIISTVMLMDPDGTRLWPVPGRRVPKGWIEAISPVPSRGALRWRDVFS